MTPRSVRRAQERHARKLARKAEGAAAALERTPEPKLSPERERQVDAVNTAAIPASQPDTEPRPAGSGRMSPARLLGNRANAQLSTGPTSETGRTTSSLNAVKTGLTGRTVLLHTDDAAEYERHVAAYEKEFSPVGQRERDLVQSIADTAWRLLRIPALEMAIYAKGRIQFANAFDEHVEALHPGMIELETFLAYEKQLRNLQLQEAPSPVAGKRISPNCAKSSKSVKRGKRKLSTPLPRSPSFPRTTRIGVLTALGSNFQNRLNRLIK